MKRYDNKTKWIATAAVFVFVFAVIFLPLFLGSSSANVETHITSGKAGNLSIVYSIVALLSVFLLVGYLWLCKKKNGLFVTLFSCIAAVNVGYFFEAVSSTLTEAMMANRLSYMGAAYSMLVMLWIVADVCQIPRRKRWVIPTVGISTAAFLLAASGDCLGLYYQAVSVETVNGVTQLVKEYGPLHPLYTVYLLSYFAVMIASIVYAFRKKRLASPKYAAFLAAIVLTNLIVWGVEQVIDTGFEFLSLSYIATGLMLLAIFSMLQDYGIVRPDGEVVGVQMLTQLHTRYVSGELPPNMEKLFSDFAEKATALTPAERRILRYYIDGHETADIPDLAYITIHTVKKHNRSIYQKLGVASRDELMLYIEMFRCCDRLHELVGKEG